MDYGTSNAFSAGLWTLYNGVAFRVDEYYFDSRKEGHQKTDEQYADEIRKLAGEHTIDRVIIDPSAASFQLVLRNRGYSVRPANNEIINGIMNVSSALEFGRVKIHERCTDLIRELGLYSWDEKAPDDRPIKEHDHACDELRYFVRTILHRAVRSFDADIVPFDGGVTNIEFEGKKLFAE